MDSEGVVMGYTTRARCDGCLTLFEREGRNQQAVSREAKIRGWRSVKGNGLMCPQCFSAYEAKRAANVNERNDTIARAAERAKIAHTMRAAGAKFREIGAALGVSPARASQLVHKQERIIRGRALTPPPHHNRHHGEHDEKPPQEGKV